MLFKDSFTFWDEIKYFSQNEFSCKCGCGHNPIKYEMVKKLDFARSNSKTPFIINRGCSCIYHNNEVGGSKTSSHLLGFAVDIRVKNDIERYDILTSLIKAGFKRIGIYKNFIHADDDLSKTQGVIWYV